jgi:hypothetical protein
MGMRLRVGALVLWRGQVVPITGRQHMGRTWVYRIETRGDDGRPQVDRFVTIGQLIQELCAAADYCVGDKVEMQYDDRYVKERWWCTRRGRIVYRVNDYYDERRMPSLFDQDVLRVRVKAWKQRA